MWHALGRHVLVGVLVAVGMTALASSAPAAVSPTLALNQSAGTTAGSTTNLGLDLKFAPTGTDSPDHMTLNLPPGLLANAAIDGGSCLTTADLTDAACQVGTGTVTATAYGIPIPTSVTFDLVPPPVPGDLAGLAVNSNGTQIGSTAEIKIRPSGDPNGVGATILFVLPNSLYGVPISITEINSTFNGLRYPTTCPATPQSVGVAVNSYGDPTVHSVTAPLSVTACSSLPYSPAFRVSATRDSTDKQVKLTTDVTQAAGQAPNRSVSLNFPLATVEPSLGALKVLCAGPSTTGCTPVGMVTASSPLYPRPLTGQAYLTGTLTGPTLTLEFPSPFPLTLIGKVDLITNTTTFSRLPDIPLTDLNVTLFAGPRGLFESNCASPSGTGKATLTDQNGDRTVTLPAQFTIANCTPPPGHHGGGTGHGGRPGGHGGSSHHGAKSARPHLRGASWSGLRRGRPTLRFTVISGRHSPKLKSLTVELPRGMRFVGHRVHHRVRIRGVSLRHATLKSLSLSHRHLVITLRKARARVTVKVGAKTLRESDALRAKARAKAKRRRLESLKLTVIARDARGKRTTLRAHVRKLDLRKG